MDTGQKIRQYHTMELRPQRFPAGRLVCSACRALECGFVMVDNVRGRGAAAPGRCRRSFFQDRQPTRIRSAPTLPRKDLSGSASSPEPVFSAPALGTAGGARLSDQGPSSRQECSLLDNILRKRREWVQEGCLERKESHSPHCERRPVVTARLVEKDGWGRAPAPPRSVLVASRQTILLTAGGGSGGVLAG